MHDFLLTYDNTLGKSTLQIPKIRQYIEELPETVTTFKLNDIEGVQPGIIDDQLVEFVGAWKISRFYEHVGNKPRKFVNPNSIHASNYTDVAVQCICGATFSRSYDDEHNNMRDEHNHKDNCKAWWRLEARSEKARKEEQLMVYLGRMGWRSSEIAVRLGVTQNSIGQRAIRNNTSMTELRDEYRTLAGNTYAHLVRTKGKSANEVAKIYDHTRTTLTRWAKKYGNYEPERGFNQFTRDKGGKYTWKYVNRAKKPSFLMSD